MLKIFAVVSVLFLAALVALYLKIEMDEIAYWTTGEWIIGLSIALSVLSLMLYVFIPNVGETGTWLNMLLKRKRLEEERKRLEEEIKLKELEKLKEGLLDEIPNEDKENSPVDKWLDKDKENPLEVIQETKAKQRKRKAAKAKPQKIIDTS